MHGRVVLVSYNEASSIGPVLAEIDEAATVLRRSGIHLDVLLVDDGSPDRTAEVARETASALGLSLEVISGQPQGPGRAFLRGFDHALRAGALDFIVTLDSDGQHDGRQIPDLVRRFCARGSGMTIGSRWTRGGRSPGTSASRTALSVVGNALIRFVTGLRGVRDATTSFRVIHPDAVALFEPSDLYVNGYGFFSSFAVLTQAQGFSIDEVPITFRPRYSGVSKLTFRAAVEFLKNLFVLREEARRLRREHLRDQTAWAQRSPRFQNQNASGNQVYGAMAELESLADAHRFFDWIVSELSPALGKSVLEVGAGIGTISQRLAANPGTLHVLALEPAIEPFETLKALADGNSTIEARQMTSQELASSSNERFDSIVYVNVLEHIERDVDELATVLPLLRPGGKLCVFVPATPKAYGSMDYVSGHYRRYRKQGLQAVIESAGYTIDVIKHFDVAGLMPYWLMYRLLDVRRLGKGSSAVFDRVLVPASRAIQTLVPNPPLGKNLIAVATRPLQDA